MQDFPHAYFATATGREDGEVALEGERLPPLVSAAPAAFGGPGDRWSPETLLTAAVGDCFVLTFRAVARASKVKWDAIQCDVTGTLDRIDRVAQFTNFEIHAHLRVPAGTDVEQARRALEKAERNCLISNSLKSTIHLDSEIVVSAESFDAPFGIAAHWAEHQPPNQYDSR